LFVSRDRTVGFFAIDARNRQNCYGCHWFNVVSLVF